MVGKNAMLMGFLYVNLVIIQYVQSSYPYPGGIGNHDQTIKASYILRSRSNGMAPINTLVS